MPKAIGSYLPKLNIFYDAGIPLLGKDPTEILMWAKKKKKVQNCLYYSHLLEKWKQVKVSSSIEWIN